MSRLISEINPKINLRDLVGLILVMMQSGQTSIDHSRQTLEKETLEQVS